MFNVLFVLMVILLSNLGLSEPMPQTDISDLCFSDQDCIDLSVLLLADDTISKEYPLCDLMTLNCYSLDSTSSTTPPAYVPPSTSPFFTDTTTNQTTTTSNVTAQNNTATQIATANLNSQVTQLKKDVQELTTRLNSVEGTERNFEQQISGLNSELQGINTKIQEVETVKNQLNNVATGLAGLQQTVEETSSDVTALEDDLEKKSSRNKMFGIIAFILIVLIVAGGISYYIIRVKMPFGKVDEKVLSYITQYIKQGYKFPQIKQKLLSAGWKEEQIGWAYKETIKKNYKNYKKSGSKDSRTSTTSSTTKVGTDKKKVITIAVVSVLLLIGVLLILNGTTGQAIFFQKTISGSGEVGFSAGCTSPHILNVDKDGCCLDQDSTGICDHIEAMVVQSVSSGAACQDSFQCPQQEFCISKTCQTLESQYTGIGDCSKQCNTYAARIKTSDGESYPVKPGQGSYTSAGAIEWKVLDGPTHCKGEPALLPIRITRKDQEGIINQEHFVLKQGETSKVITHPSVASASFTLMVERIFEWCPE